MRREEIIQTNPRPPTQPLVDRLDNFLIKGAVITGVSGFIAEGISHPWPLESVASPQLEEWGIRLLGTAVVLTIVYGASVATKIAVSKYIRGLRF